jgi:hypothetical protein
LGRNPVDNFRIADRPEVIAWRPENAECGLLPKLAEFRKKHHPTSAPRPAIIGTTDIFTDLVELHQKQRRFLKEIARKDN